MATKLPRWVGTKEIKLDPSHPKFFRNGNNEGYRFLYAGPYRALLAARPADGAQVTGYAGYYVGDLAVEPSGAGPEGPGVMTFTATSSVAGGTANENEQTVVEIDAGSLEKSIFDHPRFKDISNADRAKIKKAIENNETVPGPTLPGPVEEEVQKLYDLLSKGQESYLVSAPIVRKTTTTTAKPTVGAIGVGTRTADKPHASAPDGYVWIKTGDRASQTGRKGKWERIEEWAAADDWDEFIYGPQPSGEEE